MYKLYEEKTSIAGALALRLNNVEDPSGEIEDALDWLHESAMKDLEEASDWSKLDKRLKDAVEMFVMKPGHEMEESAVVAFLTEAKFIGPMSEGLLFPDVWVDKGDDLTLDNLNVSLDADEIRLEGLKEICDVLLDMCMTRRNDVMREIANEHEE